MLFSAGKPIFLQFTPGGLRIMNGSLFLDDSVLGENRLAKFAAAKHANKTLSN